MNKAKSKSEVLISSILIVNVLTADTTLVIAFFWYSDQQGEPKTKTRAGAISQQKQYNSKTSKAEGAVKQQG